MSKAENKEIGKLILERFILVTGSKVRDRDMERDGRFEVRQGCTERRGAQFNGGWRKIGGKIRDRGIQNWVAQKWRHTGRDRKHCQKWKGIPRVRGQRSHRLTFSCSKFPNAIIPGKFLWMIVSWV